MASDTLIKNYMHFYKPNKKNSQCVGVGILIKINVFKCDEGVRCWCDRQSFLERDEIDASYSVVSLNGKIYLLGSVFIPPNTPQVL